MTANAASEDVVVPNFRLLDQTGKSHELHRWRERKAVVLFVTASGCPIVRHTLPALKQLRDAYSPKGVEFVLIHARPDEPRDEFERELKEYAVDFPVLMDSAQMLTRELGLKRTAEVLVVATEGWHLRYRGAVDDRVDYGQQKPKAEKHYLADALDAVLAGQPVAVSRTTARGCAVADDFPDTVSYSKDITPLLQRRCVSCHSPGAVGPFAFDSYETVRRHRATIVETLLEDRMPPWHANPHHGEFSNDRSLAPEEKAVLAKWIAAGALRGEGEDSLTQAVSKPAGPWPLGKPDAIVSMPTPYELPATGILPYQVVRVKSPLTEDAWVRGVTIRAGNPKVVHHCLIFIRYPKALRHLEPPQEEGSAGFFAGYVPGTEPVFFPEGTAKFVPKGSTFIFQMHYTTTGKPESDKTELALYLSKDRPERELVTGAATTIEFEIPPGAVGHPARAEYVFQEEGLLYEFSPHMHLRGASFDYAVEYPDGRREVLLRVPRYDFNWQTLYRLKTPKRMPAGTRLVCTGTFDNSKENPANPDSTATVRFGEQTTDEMFIGYFNYSKPLGAAGAK